MIVTGRLAANSHTISLGILNTFFSGTAIYSANPPLVIIPIIPLSCNTKNKGKFNPSYMLNESLAALAISKQV